MHPYRTLHNLQENNKDEPIERDPREVIDTVQYKGWAEVLVGKEILYNSIHTVIKLSNPPPGFNSVVWTRENLIIQHGSVCFMHAQLHKHYDGSITAHYIHTCYERTNNLTDHQNWWKGSFNHAIPFDQE